MQKLKGLHGLVLLLLAGAGIALSLYYIHHYQEAIFGFSAERSFCSISSFLDCDSLQHTPTAAILGIPIGAWSLLFFLVYLHLLLLIWQLPKFWTVMAIQILAGWGLLSAIVKAFLALGLYHKLCLTCAAGWSVLFILWLLTWLWIKMPSTRSPEKIKGEIKAEIKTLGKHIGKHGVIALLTLAVSLIIVPNMMMSAQSKKTIAYAHETIQKILQEGPRPIPEGIISPNPPAGDYTKGRSEAPITLLVFHDFECPVCDRQSQVFQRLLTSFSTDILFVLKNFPLDHNCNPNINFLMHQKACYWAEVARCIGQEQPQSFWIFYEIYHREDPKENFSEIASHFPNLAPDVIAQCVSQHTTVEAIQTDIAQGEALYVHATPTFFINGYRFEGYFPYYVLEQFVLKLLKK